MSGLIKCIACGKDRRVDRLSHHILEQHRENLLSLPRNKKILEETIRFKEGTIKIALSNPVDKTDVLYYICSFGYDSGWRDKVSKKMMEKVIEHKEEHLKKCGELLQDFQPITEDTSLEFDKLQAKYTALLEKCNVLEAEKIKKDREDSNLQKIKKLEETVKQKTRFTNELSRQIEEHQSCIEILQRYYNIDGADIVERVESAYANYSGDELEEELEKIKPFDEEDRKKEEEALQRRRAEAKKLIEQQTKTYGDDFEY
jgi:hypothetical protein